MIYNSIIIGRGLFGSAAAKYISQSQEKVALIGPDEETCLKEGVVFASHYDQARIQRIVGKDPVATLLNLHTASQHSQLETESKIHYHSNEGCLRVTPDEAKPYVNYYLDEAGKLDVNYQLFKTSNELKSFNSLLEFPTAACGIYETSPSGHINPRLMIKAQSVVFKKNGGEIFNNTIQEIVYEEDYIKITSTNNKVFCAEKVLLATGAFTNFLQLLQRKLVFKLKSETTIWVKVTEAEALRLSSLPMLLYKINEPEIQDIYLVRPIKYPDGNYYLKMGANLPTDCYFNNLAEVQTWFKNGYKANNIPILTNTLKSILPGISFEKCHEKRCIVTYTAHGKPYIGAIEKNRLFIAAGGNGYGAMCSDSIGKIAANFLLENKFPDEYQEKDFIPVFEE